MAVGSLVQYTSIGNSKELSALQLAKAKVEDRKVKWAVFFYSFSPVANLSQLFNLKQSGDSRLSVLNGVRVLST